MGQICLAIRSNPVAGVGQGGIGVQGERDRFPAAPTSRSEVAAVPGREFGMDARCAGTGSMPGTKPAEHAAQQDWDCSTASPSLQAHTLGGWLQAPNLAFLAPNRLWM